MNLLNKYLFNLLVVALFAAGASGSVFAQATVSTPPPCPTIMVSSPDSVGTGQPLTYTANVSGGDPNVTPTYNWTISGGIISTGQGTSTITVDTKGVSGDSAITATVDVGGYDRGCSTSSSGTTVIMKAAAPEGRKIDDYGPIATKDAQKRLDSLAIELQSDPTAQGYIIIYAGAGNKAGTAQKSIAMMKDHLLKKRKVEAARLVIIDGGYRNEQWVEIWLLPPGATPPTASPTIDPSEIQSPKKPAPKTFKVTKKS